MTRLPTVHGRGAPDDPPNRFQRLHVEVDAAAMEELARQEGWRPGEEREGPATRYYRDPTRSVLTRNDSPDVGFSHSLNPYRGCEHGCAYCYARPGHEYLGYSAGVDFESRILVKEAAPRLLRAALTRLNPPVEPLALSGVTDPYQPVERRLEITRQCLEVLAEARHPVSIITKNQLVTRDVDLLAELAGHEAAVVTLSITTLDPELRRSMEPRTSAPDRRLRAIRVLTEAGVPVGVNVAPVVPGLTDHEIPRILEAAAEAGAHHAGYTPLRLPGAVAGLFQGWLEDVVPERKERVLERIREMRGGRLNDPRFGSRMRGQGVYARQLHQLFQVAARKVGLHGKGISLNGRGFRPPTPPRTPADPGQLDLFGPGGDEGMGWGAEPGPAADGA